MDGHVVPLEMEGLAEAADETVVKCGAALQTSGPGYCGGVLYDGVFGVELGEVGEAAVGDSRGELVEQVAWRVNEGLRRVPG